jgi:Cu/Zn superoxide dismutase
MNNKKPLIEVDIINDKKIKGRVYFRENPAENNIIIDLNLQGLKKNFRHGFHCHESGEIEENCCETVCKHFNPYKKNHG